VAEELGIHPRIGPLLVADWAPSQAEGDKILFIFDGGHMDSLLTDQVVLPADELSEWRFHSEADLENALIPRLARRVVAALEAKHRTRTTTWSTESTPWADGRPASTSPRSPNRG
jgi:hypothetical protein